MRLVDLFTVINGNRVSGMRIAEILLEVVVIGTKNMRRRRSKKVFCLVIHLFIDVNNSLP